MGLDEWTSRAVCAVSFGRNHPFSRIERQSLMSSHLPRSGLLVPRKVGKLEVRGFSGGLAYLSPFESRVKTDRWLRSSRDPRCTSAACRQRKKYTPRTITLHPSDSGYRVLISVGRMLNWHMSYNGYARLNVQASRTSCATQNLGSYRPQRGVGVVLRTVPRIGIASFIEPPGRERTSLGVRRRFRGLLAPQSVDGAECGTLASV